MGNTNEMNDNTSTATTAMDEEQRRQAWLAKRKGYITGTDAACLLGISKWGSRFSVWLDKTGQGEPVAESEPMKWGHRLERPILAAYAEETGYRTGFADGYDLRTNPKFPRLGASLDGWNHDMNCPVDAKNIRVCGAEWGEAWTDEFPAYYKSQLQVQMMVTGAAVAHLAVLFSGQELRVYQMEYDEELAAKILKAVEEFWPLVECHEMPEAGGDEGTTAFVKGQFAKGVHDKKKDPTDEFKADVKALVSLKAQKKDVETLIAERENRIKVFLGDATVVDNWVTWKNAKDSEVVDYKTIAETLLARLPDEEKAGIVKNHTTTKTGARTLRITNKG